MYLLVTGTPLPAEYRSGNNTRVCVLITTARNNLSAKYMMLVRAALGTDGIDFEIVRFLPCLHFRFLTVLVK